MHIPKERGKRKIHADFAPENGLMAEVAGIICEYDPFHRGHGRQLALVRERLPHAAIVCVMSGCFTQRGAPALYAPGLRARAALDAGAAPQEDRIIHRTIAAATVAKKNLLEAFIAQILLLYSL